MVKEWSTFDIQNAFDIPRPNLQAWQRAGFIEPSIAVASGRGTKNLFSDEDVCQILLFQALCDAGFSQQQAQEFVSDMSWKIADKSRYYVMVKRREGRMVTAERSFHSSIPSQVPKGGIMTIVDLEQIKAKVGRKH